MNDLLPEVAERWQYVEAIARDVLHAHGYREIRLPIIEQTELYARSIGQHTDIVEKEMYTFEDRNGDKLTLRPEGTAGCVRAGIENGLLHNQVQRLWYAGPMFRHERPQKGRYRQFHQIGVEAFGIPGPEVEAEHILMSARLWKKLAIEDIKLEINSLGTPEARSRYRGVLVAYLRDHDAELDVDSTRRLETNPLRVLDSKEPSMQGLIAKAPKLRDYLEPPSTQHFSDLCGYLDATGVRYTVNPRLVRGLDYYTDTVFEWTSTRLGAQATVCAGGRYDGLVAQLGGKASPAVGFALGLERVVELLTQVANGAVESRPQVYLAILYPKAQAWGLSFAESLRDQGLRVECDYSAGLKAQLKRADRSGARFALLIGEDEYLKKTVTLKDLRSGHEQVQLSPAQVKAVLMERLARARA